MVQLLESKGSYPKSKPLQVTKYCLYCHRKYKGSAQSKYCSKTHTEQAARRRKQELIEALAAFFCQHSDRIDQARALDKARECVNSKQRYQVITLKFTQLGYTYDEWGRAWTLQPRLAASVH